MEGALSGLLQWFLSWGFLVSPVARLRLLLLRCCLLLYVMRES